MRFAHRFTQVHRVVDDGKSRHDIAMPDEMFRNCGGVALRDSVSANPSTLEVGRRDRQYVAFIFSRRKAGEGMWRIRGWVRAPIHIDGSIDLRNLSPISDGHQSLRDGIAFFPNPMISGGHPRVGDSVAHALVLFHRQTRRGPGNSIKTRSIVQGNSTPTP